MQAASDRFLEALRDSHRVALRALVYRPGSPTPIEAPVVGGGSIRADRDARVRRQGQVTLAFSLANAGPIVRTLPFGGYCRIERGIEYPDGERELVPLGHLRIESATWNAEEGQATLTLADRFAQVQDEAFTVPWAPAGMLPSQAIVAAVHDVFGDAIAYDVATDPALEAVIQDVIYDEDRAQAIGDLASGIAADAFFAADGSFQLRPDPDLALAEPVWTIDAGRTGAMEGALENVDRTTVRNGVAVRGQGDADTPPVFALAVDADPESPTRWGGPFGKVPTISNSTSVMTQAQADASASSQLRLRLGAARKLTLQALPNPALEPDDAVTIEFADGRTEKQLVNAVEVPLATDGPITVETSSQWRPDLAEPRREIHVFSGDYAWRELAEALA